MSTTDAERLAPALVSVPENVLQGLHEMIDGRDATIATLRAERDDILKAEHALSAAYLRLRSLIPGAYNTPHAPSPEQVWETTETALRKLAERDEANRSNEYLSNELAKLHGDLVQERDEARTRSERLEYIARMGRGYIRNHCQLFHEGTGPWVDLRQVDKWLADLDAAGAAPPTTNDPYSRRLKQQRAKDVESRIREIEDRPTDDVERAREFMRKWKPYVANNERFTEYLAAAFSAARAQGRAEGAREMRERVLKRIADFGSGHAVTIAAAIRSLPEDSQ
jgi:hypothetical protein